jgi:murein DD-endopeptidase MepM/ murein hydrolase activator NlpD
MRVESLAYRLWFLLIVLLVVVNLALFSLHLSMVEAASKKSRQDFPTASHAIQAFTDFFATTSKKVGHGVVSAKDSVWHGAQSVATATSRGVISGVAAVAQTPSHVLDSALSAPAVKGLTEPAAKSSLPVITPVNALPIKPVKSTGKQHVVQIAARSHAKPQWPLHGAITNPFGVSDWPYETVHTGIDISDGTAPGSTPVRPFLPGRVIEVISSYSGLGNHIVIDNGGGVTSVYGHLNSVSVSMGQTVDEHTVLGYEGTTGASTGTHLHFEIHVNSVPVNPLNYLY